jgi:hypothetical protein
MHQKKSQGNKKSVGRWVGLGFSKRTGFCRPRLLNFYWAMGTEMAGLELAGWRLLLLWYLR